MASFCLSHTNREHSYPGKQGICSCSYPYHKRRGKLSAGSVMQLFHIGVLCGLAHLLQARWSQTSAASRALNRANTQDRHTRESEWRACPKPSNPIPHHSVQSDHIFHLANTSCPPLSNIRVFVHSPLIYLKSVLKPPCYDSQKIPLISTLDLCILSFHMYVFTSLAQIILLSSLWIYRLISTCWGTIIPPSPSEIKAMLYTENIFLGFAHSVWY